MVGGQSGRWWCTLPVWSSWMLNLHHWGVQEESLSNQLTRLFLFSFSPWLFVLVSELRCTIPVLHQDIWGIDYSLCNLLSDSHQTSLFSSCFWLRLPTLSSISLTHRFCMLLVINLSMAWHNSCHPSLYVTAPVLSFSFSFQGLFPIPARAAQPFLPDLLLGIWPSLRLFSFASLPYLDMAESLTHVTYSWPSEVQEGTLAT